MPKFRLRKIPDEENSYCIVQRLEDGYELRIGARVGACLFNLKHGLSNEDFGPGALLTEATVLPVDYCHYFHGLKRR
jgi:hypothetical protein